VCRFKGAYTDRNQRLEALAAPAMDKVRDCYETYGHKLAATFRFGFNTRRIRVSKSRIVCAGQCHDGYRCAGLVGGLLGISELSPWQVLVLIYLVTATLTKVITNNAVAVITSPIALALSQQLDVSVLLFAVTIMFAASASFITPLGYQTNMIAFGPGRYKFSGYVKISVPLSLIASAVNVTPIPIVWSF
jgi:hypothetical protein